MIPLDTHGRKWIAQPLKFKRDKHIRHLKWNINGTCSEGVSSTHFKIHLDHKMHFTFQIVGHFLFWKEDTISTSRVYCWSSKRVISSTSGASCHRQLHRWPRWRVRCLISFLAMMTIKWWLHRAKISSVKMANKWLDIFVCCEVLAQKLYEKCQKKIKWENVFY